MMCFLFATLIIFLFIFNCIMCIDARTLNQTHAVCGFQVMYFSSIFPYVVLAIFLVRGLMLDGALEGITYMFYPKVSTLFSSFKRYIYIDE